MSTIGDRVPIVRSLLGGRTDQDSNISNWIANSYKDIGSTVPFETLEDTEDNLTVGNIPTYDYPDNARAIKAITLFTPAGTKNASIPLRKRNVNIIDRYSNLGPGVPVIWAPYKNQYILKPIPDNGYVVTIRFWNKPSTDPDDINVTELLVPDDWLEIIDYGAQQRGYFDLQEFDKSQAIRTLLNGTGDPKKPGLIKQRLTRIQAEYMDANYGLRPRMQRYSNTH